MRKIIFWANSELFRIVVVAVVHFCLFMVSFSSSMEKFDRGESLNVLDKITERFVKLLGLPFVPLAIIYKPNFVQGIYEYFPIVINSLIWGIILVAVWDKCKKKSYKALNSHALKRGG